MSGLAVTLYWAATIGFGVAFAATLVAQRLDVRRLGSENVWAKPAKFSLSLALHFATMALASSLLGPSWQDNGAMTALAIVTTACGVLELAYIALQAGRQLPSHFYVGTPLYAALYAAMGIGAVIIVLGAGVIGAIAWLDPAVPLVEPLRSALGIGLVGGTILTLITALRLGSNMSHAIGVEAPVPLRMPLTGWSLTRGDLRPAHFLATHMMQVVPVMGLVASWVLPPTPALVAVWLFGAAWTWLTVATFRLALTGRPLRLPVLQGPQGVR